MTPLTEAAQRRLLEALAALSRTPGGVPGFLYAFPVAIAAAEEVGSPELANVWRCLADLAEAVDVDRQEASA